MIIPPTDEDRFPDWGKHAGKKYGEIPGDYLLWVLHNVKLMHVPDGGLVRAYIDDNKELLKREYKEKYGKDYGRL